MPKLIKYFSYFCISISLPLFIGSFIITSWLVLVLINLPDSDSLSWFLSGVLITLSSLCPFFFYNYYSGKIKKASREKTNASVINTSALLYINISFILEIIFLIYYFRADWIQFF